MGGKSRLHNIEGLIDHNISNKFVMDHKVLFLCVYFHDSRELKLILPKILDFQARWEVDSHRFPQIHENWSDFS